MPSRRFPDAGDDSECVVTFRSFAKMVRNRLWLLGIAAEFDFTAERARLSHAAYVVDLIPIDPTHARVMLTANGELLHASEPGPQTEFGAKMLSDAIALWFGGPPDEDEEP